ADDRVGDLAVHVRDRFPDAFAEVPRLVAVAELEGFALARRRARRHRGAANRPAVERHIDFDGRIPARVEDFAPVHAVDLHWTLRVRLAAAASSTCRRTPLAAARDRWMRSVALRKSLGAALGIDTNVCGLKSTSGNHELCTCTIIR